MIDAITHAFGLHLYIVCAGSFEMTSFSCFVGMKSVVTVAHQWQHVADVVARADHL